MPLVSHPVSFGRCADTVQYTKVLYPPGVERWPKEAIKVMLKGEKRRVTVQGPPHTWRICVMFITTRCRWCCDVHMMYGCVHVPGAQEKRSAHPRQGRTDTCETSCVFAFTIMCHFSVPRSPCVCHSFTYSTVLLPRICASGYRLTHLGHTCNYPYIQPYVIVLFVKAGCTLKKTKLCTHSDRNLHT